MHTILLFQVTRTEWGYASVYDFQDANDNAISDLYQGPDADDLDDMHNQIREEAKEIGATSYTITYAIEE